MNRMGLQPRVDVALRRVMSDLESGFAIGTSALQSLVERGKSGEDTVVEDNRGIVCHGREHNVSKLCWSVITWLDLEGDTLAAIVVHDGAKNARFQTASLSQFGETYRLGP